jgi:hypothetical protein
MEALAGLSLACNVMQVMSFAHETFSLCKKIYSEGEANPSLGANAKTMAILTKALQNTILDHAAKPVTEADHELQSIARKCLDAANRLAAKLEDLGQANSKGHIKKTVKSAFKHWWRSDELQQLRDEMREYQITLDSGLLLRIWFVIPFESRNLS